MMMHLCHAWACNEPVPPARFMCRRHWYMLPKEMRDEVWATYRRRQEVTKDPSDDYLAAASRARRWLAIKEGIIAEATT